MRQLIWGLALVLAGCVAAPEEPAPQSIRNPKAMISSAALFDGESFGGDWRVAASAVPGCAGASQSWRWMGQGYALSGIDCAGRVPSVLKGRATLTGPGARLDAKGGFGDEPIWVLWVDQDYRVAVLGTPSGRWGMVLSRQMPARDDLMRAAREVLDFNGYDVSRVGR